jgi:hypothetical protein
LVELVRVMRSRIITVRFSDSYGGANSGNVGLGEFTPVAQSDLTSQTCVVISASQVDNPDILGAGDPKKFSAIMDSNTDTAGLRVTGRQSQTSLPAGDGVLNLSLNDLILNNSLNT